MSIPVSTRLAKPNLTHQMMYSDPAYEHVDPRTRTVRGVLFDIKEQDSGLGIAGHYVRGMRYDWHFWLAEAYADLTGQGPVDDEENTQVFGSVEIDGVARAPLLFTTELPGGSPATEMLQIWLWLGKATDPPFEDMNKLVAVRNSLIHVAAVALQQSLESSLDDRHMICYFNPASGGTWEELKIRPHGYSDLCEQLANAPAPEMVLPGSR